MSDSWHGAPAHTEFGSGDTKATMDFMSGVFGLKFEGAGDDSPMEYNTAYTPGQPSTAVRPIMEMEKGPSSTAYFLTDDIDRTIAEAEARGATIILPKTEVPGGMGYMSWMMIPGGITIATMQGPS